MLMTLDGSEIKLGDEVQTADGPAKVICIIEMLPGARVQVMFTDEYGGQSGLEVRPEDIGAQWVQ